MNIVCIFDWCYDTCQNDINHNATQHNDTQGITTHCDSKKCNT